MTITGAFSGVYGLLFNNPLFPVTGVSEDGATGDIVFSDFDVSPFFEQNVSGYATMSGRMSQVSASEFNFDFTLTGGSVQTINFDARLNLTLAQLVQVTANDQTFDVNLNGYTSREQEVLFAYGLCSHAYTIVFNRDLSGAPPFSGTSYDSNTFTAAFTGFAIDGLSEDTGYTTITGTVGANSGGDVTFTGGPVTTLSYPTPDWSASTFTITADGTDYEFDISDS